MTNIGSNFTVRAERALATPSQSTQFTISPQSVGAIQFRPEDCKAAIPQPIESYSSTNSGTLGSTAALLSSPSTSWTSTWTSSSPYPTFTNAAPPTTVGYPVTSMLPVAQPNSQLAVYDRYIFANRRSRLRDRGDPYRGDVSIVPSTYPLWQSSAYPNIDLQTGYFGVVGGATNRNAIELARLIYASSGNTQSVIGGQDLSAEFNNPNSPYYTGNLTGLSGNVNINGFV